MNNKILCSKKHLVLGLPRTFHIQRFVKVLYSGFTLFCIEWFSKYPLGGFEWEAGKEFAQVEC